MAHPNIHSVSSVRKWGGKTVYTRYVGEQHVKEDCNNYIPSAKEWIQVMNSETKPLWVVKTMKIDD